MNRRRDSVEKLRADKIPSRGYEGYLGRLGFERESVFYCRPRSEPIRTSVVRLPLDDDIRSWSGLELNRRPP
jgi:hypothetical protein